MSSSKILLLSDDLDTAQIWSYILAQKGVTTTILSPSDEDHAERRLDRNTLY